MIMSRTSHNVQYAGRNAKRFCIIFAEPPLANDGVIRCYFVLDSSFCLFANIVRVIFQFMRVVGPIYYVLPPKGSPINLFQIMHRSNFIVVVIKIPFIFGPVAKQKKSRLND